MFNFEKLEVWQKARNFVEEIYRFTSDFPEKERFGLTQHIRKTAVSISSNIAEGTSRLSPLDFQRFIQIAMGSIREMVAQLYVALDIHYIQKEAFEGLYKDCEELSKMLSGLSKSLNPRSAKSQLTTNSKL